MTTTLSQSQCDPAVQDIQKEMNSLKKQITDEFSAVMQQLQRRSQNNQNEVDYDRLH